MVHRLEVFSVDHREPRFAVAIHTIQSTAYAQEAQWLGLDARDFPPAQRTLPDTQSANEQFIVASNGDLIVAAISVESPDTATWCGHRLNTVHIASLVVMPTHQRKGIGRRLVETVITSHPKVAITVSTASGNTPALALYGNLGFAETRRSRVNCGHRHIELILLRREPSQGLDVTGSRPSH